MMEEGKGEGKAINNLQHTGRAFNGAKLGFDFFISAAVTHR